MPYPLCIGSVVLCLQTVEEDEVLQCLRGLSIKKATGVDGISAYLLKSVAPEVAPSLAKIFNISISSGEIPNEWKKAIVTPVPKSRSAKLPSDYRPISVLPVIVKVYEKMIHRQLFSYLTSYSILSKQQYGFRPQHSTQDALLRTVEDWRVALDKGCCVGTVLVDLSKAFDSINHSILLQLEAYGINSDALLWFRNYLEGRQQKVTVDGCSSDWEWVKTGVPQGSIFGSSTVCPLCE